MPTINQLVRKSRDSKIRKSKSPHLAIGYNSLKKVYTSIESPQKRGVCTRVTTMTPKNQTQLFVNMPEFVYLMVSKLLHIFQV